MNDAGNEHAEVIPVPPPMIYLGPLLLGLLVHRARPVPLLPDRLARLFAWPLLGNGIALSLWFLFTMRRAHTTIVPHMPVTRLVVTGPFGFSRNPAYVALTLIYVGLSGVVNTLWPLCALPLVLAVLRRGVIDPEERYLAQRFGAEYAHYQARVRRWL